MDLCRGGGRLAEALALATQKADYTRRAGLGSWTQLADEVRRLQVLAAMGRADQVLAAVQRLREHMQALPAVSDQSETVTPWGVRETLLDTGRDAALQLSRWDEALELSAAAAASKQDRGAPAGEIARARFNDYYPLIRLGHTGEALALLLECRRAFEQARDIQGLGTVLMALADVENTRGHGEAAISLARDALRYCYLAGDVTAIAVSYHNLGNYLARHARQPAAALACRLAAALIRALARAEGADRSARAAADDLRAAGAGADPPTDVPGLCRQAGGIPGADLDRLLAALAPEPGAAQRVLGELLAQVRDLAAAPPAADPGT